MGVINYYRSIWPRRSHTLVPLTKLMSINRNFKRTQVEQDAFNETNWIVARDTISTYPDFNEIFKIHTDASAFQLVEVTSQKGKPIAFYSRKPTDDQEWYRVKETELPSIVETLKEFRTILLSH